MSPHPVGLGAALAGLGAALLIQPPTFDALRTTVSWLVRPAVLPFAWPAVAEAERAGDANEVFARAQQILQWLPEWTDGHAVFAYRFALTGPADGDAAAALRRLDIAMAWLEGARTHAGRREVELLQTMALLPTVAEAQTPGLAALLAPRGGSAAIADRCLASAEALTTSPSVREQRTFFAPWLAGAMLDAGQRAAALAVLRTAIERSRDVRDRALAEAWRHRLEECVRWLAGDRSVDLTAVRDDARFVPLHRHLR